ncbi:MAG: hypothetical protein ABEJ73_00345 [Haloplanus sp.]
MRSESVSNNQGEKRVDPSTTDEAIERHLRSALDAAETREAKFHLRQALQLAEVFDER